jgi:hypothetical protein
MLTNTTNAQIRGGIEHELCEKKKYCSPCTPPLLLPPQTCCGARDLPAARSPAAWRRLPRCDAPPRARRRHPIGPSSDVCVGRRRGDVDSPTALSPEPRPPPRVLAPPPAVADLCCTLILRLSYVLVGGPTTTTHALHTCSANRPPQLRPSTARSPETHFHGLLLLHHAAAAGIAGDVGDAAIALESRPAAAARRRPGRWREAQELLRAFMVRRGVQEVVIWEAG